MATINDGGPAFPCDLRLYAGHELAGMTLRDYFAAVALGVVMKQWAEDAGPEDEDSWNDPRGVARVSYMMADAMLAERPRRGSDRYHARV